MEVRSPALLPNILKLASHEGGRSLIIGRVMVHQFRYSISIECGPADAPLAALMFYPNSPEEFFLCGLATVEAAGDLIEIVRIGQLTVRRVAENTGCEISCFVQPGRSSGFRLASLLGFSISGPCGREQKMRFGDG